MNAKLDNAISDIVGVTRQRIVRAIAAGERDAPKLAKLRHAGMRASEGEIVKSLQGKRRDFRIRELIFVL